VHITKIGWDWIRHNISKLQDLLRSYDGGLDPLQDLPKDCFDLLSETRYFIENISADLIDMVLKDSYACPRLRKFHFRESGSGFHTRCYLIQTIESDALEDRLAMRLLRLLNNLKDKGVRNYFTSHVVLDEYERFMQEEPQAKELISPLMASHISQLSILTECLQHFHQFQPWARAVEHNIAQNQDKYIMWYDTTMKKWGAMHMVYQQFETRKIYQVCSPKDGKFNYLADQRRTRDTVNAMIKAEAALDTFWNVANAHWRRTVGTTPFTLVQHIMGDRVPQRTMPWVEPKQEFASVIETFPNHTHDISKQITGSFDKLGVETKIKAKTRGVVVTEEELPVIQDAAPDTQPTAVFTVDKRALKVFKNLFHSPHSPDQAGQVLWRDFLHAMASVGFGGEKLQGSAWHFTPNKVDAERSIQFHEPHPGNKLPVNWARRYGRRLARAFGWTGESFSLA
jgi:hypothetical protein